MTYMKNLTTEVCVVGGGAAGLMAAVSAAAAGARVTVLEREERPLRKLRITGKGRCNVTNNCEPEQVMKNTVHNGRFLFSALRAFPPAAAMRFFEELGVPLKTERGNRVFPVSDRAGDVAEALLRGAGRMGVVMTCARVRELIRDEEGRIAGVKWENGSLTAPAVILATGGLSYPATGSTGDGYGLAEAVGHSVVPCRPSLVPLVSPDPDCAAMQGLSLKNVRLSLMEAGKGCIRQEQGEMQFTHFGVTGPMILSASAYMEPGKTYSLELDLKPALDEAVLDRRLLHDFGENRNRDFRNALGDLLPRLMIPVIVGRSGIPPETKVNAVTREQRRALLQALKHFRISISGTRPIEEAVITSGGIDLRQTVPATMGSRLVKGLYFAGELLDLDACTGGFNLQIAWSTGRAAGLAAAAYAKGAAE